MYAASSEMVASLGIWWVSLQSTESSEKAQLSPSLRACSTTIFTHTALSVEFDSDHLVSTTFEALSMIKSLTDLIHSYSKCALIYTPILRQSLAAGEDLLGKG